MYRRTIVVLAGIGACALASTASAKKVVCVDGGGDAFLSNAEGYYRASTGAGDQVHVGGSLTTCLGNVASGDCLVIVAHGKTKVDEDTGEIEYGFCWGGQTYCGFGSGEGEMPVPPSLGMAMNVMIKFVSCWSACPGQDGTSMVDDLKGECGGGSTGSGYPGIVEAPVYYELKGGTKEEKKKAEECLDMNSGWMDNPPTNRPGTGGQGQPPNQQGRAQSQLAGCPGTGNVKVCIPARVGTPAGPKEKPPCRTGYLPPVAATVTNPPGSKFAEVAFSESEPLHSFITIKSLDGQWIANIQNTTGGAGQCIDLSNLSLPEDEDDGVYETLHYVAAGTGSNRPLLRVEEHFRLVAFKHTATGFSAMLRAASAAIPNRRLCLEIDGTMLSGENGGLSVTITYLNTATQPIISTVRPITYVDLDADHTIDDDLVFYGDGGFVQESVDSGSGVPWTFSALDTVAVQSDLFPDLMLYLDQRASGLNGDVVEAIGNHSLAVEHETVSLAPGESYSISYVIGGQGAIAQPRDETP